MPYFLEKYGFVFMRVILSHQFGWIVQKQYL